MRLFSILAATLLFVLSAEAQTVSVDPSGANTGTLQNGLQFGKARSRKVPGPRGQPPRTITVPPGEGIASKQDAGGNQFGLDLFTNATPRLSVTANGNIGIGNLQGLMLPTKALEVHTSGDVEVGLQSNDEGGRLWTLQSSGVTKGPLDATFQIIDRTANLSRLQIDGTGTVTVGVLRITGGADLAEPFQASDAEVPPGSVMIIDENND